MKTEFEVKFLDITEEFVKKKLKALKAQQQKQKFLMKRQVFHLNTIPDTKDIWARVRDEGDKVTMSVKYMPDPNRVDGVKEAEVIVDSFARASSLLIGLGLIPASYQENYREVWKLGSCEIAIDTWPGLSPFLEIEGKSETAVREASELLDFRYEDGTFGSIDMIYAKKYKIPREVITTAEKLTFESFPYLLVEIPQKVEV